MLDRANKYIENNVFAHEVWSLLDDKNKTTALNRASLDLYNYYKGRFNKLDDPIPEEAIFLQALFLVEKTEPEKYAEKGVKMYMVDGMQVVTKDIDRSISPYVIKMLGRKLGRSVNSRNGYIV